MKAKLIVVGGTTSATEVVLRLPTIIGRGRSAAVTIPHSLVSRQHCEISEDDGRLVVRDLDSLNGTYVGDERITEAILEPGSLLTVGTVTFRAIYEVGCSDTPEEFGTDSLKDQPAILEPMSSERTLLTDAETVPVGECSLGESTLPPRLLGSPDADTEQVSQEASESSFESVAQNSD